MPSFHVLGDRTVMSPSKISWRALGRAKMDMTRSGSAENKPNTMVYNISGLILAVHRNVTRTDNTLQKRVHMPPQMTSFCPFALKAPKLSGLFY